MLRRAIGLGVLGLGACLLGAALAVRLFLVPGLVKLPLDQQAHREATGTNVDFFDIGAQEQKTGLSAEVKQNAEGDPSAAGASGSVAVWSFGSAMTGTDGTLLNAYGYTVCLDRHTAESVSCDSTRVDGASGVDIKGLTMTFPFGTEKKDYDVFNPTAEAAFPAKFAGEETIKGVDVYRFEQTVPETVVQSTEVPGTMAGQPDQATVTADIVYSNQRTMWVEPTSGVIVSAEEHPLTVVRGPDGTTGVTILAGDFAATDKTVSDAVKDATKVSSQITMVKVVLPLALAGLGVVLLLVGVFLLRRSAVPDAERPEAVTEERVPQVH
jgi:hypothetical protein